MCPPPPTPMTPIGLIHAFQGINETIKVKHPGLTTRQVENKHVNQYTHPLTNN